MTRDVLKDLDETISKLQRATGEAKSLDSAIADSLGWIRRNEIVAGRTVQRWTSPEGDTQAMPPPWTSSVQAAMELQIALFPGRAGAVSVEVQKGATAIIENGPKSYGATPAIALCIAALKTLEQDSRRR